MAPRLLLQRDIKPLILLFTLLSHGYFLRGQVPVPTAASPQTFCEGATVAYLQASGTNPLQLLWYPTAGSDTPLARNTPLQYGQKYYVAEYRTSSKNHVTTVTGGLGTGRSDVVTGRGNHIYFTDGNAIKKYDMQTETVSIFAGSSAGGSTDGKGDQARFSQPGGLAIDENYNLYVADTGNGKIRMIDSEGNVTTIAGAGGPGDLDGPAASALFNSPFGIACDSKGNLFVADFNNHKIRMIRNGQVSTLAGNGTPNFADGSGTAARFHYPIDITVDSNGDLFVADNMNYTIRKVTVDGQVSTIFNTNPNGSGDSPAGIAAGAGRTLYITRINHSITQLTYNSATSMYEAEALTGSTAGDIDGIYYEARISNPQGITLGGDGALYFAELSNKLKKIHSQSVTEYSSRREVEVILSVLSVNIALDASQTATANAVGLSDPFTYEWSPSGATTPVVSGLEPGQHTVTVTDMLGCTASSSVTITGAPALEVTITESNHIPCYGGYTGSATAAASGGTAPYTYLWSSGATTARAEILPAGTYTVIVTDADGATASAQVTLTQPAARLLLQPPVVSPATCYGLSDGAFEFTTRGGDKPYSYHLPDGIGTVTITSDSTVRVTGMPRGYHLIEITDARGCTASLAPFIAEPPLLTVPVTDLAHSSGPGIADGSATVQAAGGTAPYTYAWSNGAATATITGLAAGDYTVTATDINGCEATNLATVSEAAGLNISVINISHIPCGNQPLTGRATASVTGGTPPYSYAWSNLETTAEAIYLNKGTYTVTVTDANGVTAVAHVTITAPEGLNYYRWRTANASCSGQSDGELDYYVLGGVKPYTYSFAQGTGTLTPTSDSTVTATGLAPGPYLLQVTDANGCIFTNSYNVIISQNSLVSADIISRVNVSAPGAADGSATAQGVNGVSPYSYLWSNGATTAMASGLTGGNYTVTVTDDLGCTADTTVTIFEEAGTPLQVSIVSYTDASCTGRVDGRATAQATGGTAPYTYLWSNGGIHALSTSLRAGTYSVTVTDADGTTATTNVTIGEPADSNPVLSILSRQNPSCHGVNDGVIEFRVRKGTAPYTYSLSIGTGNITITGDSTARITGLGQVIQTGSYQVIRVQDANGCIDNQATYISSPDPITATLHLTDASAAGGADGAATVQVSGGTAPYSYLWSTGATTPAITGLAPGSYPLTITDTNGCTADTTASIAVASAPALSVVITDSTHIRCLDTPDGKATALATGGTAPYSYAWSNGATTPEISGVNAGRYTVIVTDANGATATTDVVLNQQGALNLFVNSSTHISCNGGSDGQVLLRVRGGVAPYTYTWDMGSGNLVAQGDSFALATHLTAQFYRARVTDANGCIADRNFGLSEPDPLTASITDYDNVSTSGASDGTATAEATGGTGPYSYLWSNGATTAAVTGLVAGNYTVTVTDDKGCETTTAVTISDSSAPITLNVSITDSTHVSCFGASDGTATALATGGTAPYTYAWSNGATTPAITGVSAGTYTVTVTDAAGVTATTEILLNQPAELGLFTMTGSVIHVSCNGGSDGQIDLRVRNGTPPYTYSFGAGSGNLAATGDSTVRATALTARTYSVRVTDADGCRASRTFAISQPDILTASITGYNNVSTPGGSDGTATAEATGGTGPYSYLWSNGATTAAVTGLAAGNYTLTVTDDQGCQATTAVTISGSSTPVTLNVSITDSTPISCFGTPDGTATALATGGTAPYTYAWSNGATTPGITGVSAGTYTVTVTDAGGATAATTVTLTAPAALTVSVTQQTHATAPGATDGTATAQAAGGTAPYSYLWSNGATTAAVTGLAAGTYTLTVTDDQGCQAHTTVTITAPSGQVPLSVTITGSTNVSCSGLADGSATAAASGGTVPYTYAWSNGAATAVVTGLSAGTYTVTVTDDRGDTATAQVTITGASPAGFEYVSLTQPQSCGNADGSISFRSPGLTNGNYPLFYAHDGDDRELTVHVFSGTFTMVDLLPGVYSNFRIENQNCTHTLGGAVREFTLNNPVAPGGTITPDGPTELCEDDMVTLTAPEGSSYQWSNGQTTRSITVSTAGTYTVTVTAANGCEFSTGMTVTKKICNLPPVAVCKPLVVIVANPNDCYSVVTPKDLDAGSYDPNGDWTRHTLLNTDGIFRPGTHTITYEVMDPKGAFSTCQSEVRVLDHTPPVARARDLNLELDANGRATISLADVDAGSYDNCGPVTLSLNRTTFDCSDLGNLQVRLTVTDASGNVSEALSDITISDNTPPVIQANNVTLTLDENGRATVSTESLTGSISDNCGIWDISVSQNEFTCEHLGENTVIITVQDVRGNRSTATVTVTVLDNTPPVINIRPVTLYLDATGKATLTATEVDNGSKDNCGITGLSLDRQSFDCTDLGDQQLTLTATDAAGNTSDTTFTVTVLDTLAPVVQAKDITLYLDEAGQASLSPEDIDEGSSDNCGIAERKLQYSTFSCSDTGTRAVEYTVTDGSGNHTTVIVQVSIRDTLAPEAITQNVVLELDWDGKATLAASEADGGSSDNCSIAEMSLSQADFSCTDLGRRLVTLTVKDVNGNQATARAVVEVKDPNGVCPCSYGVLAFDGIKLKDNEVSAGGVGVINRGKKVKLRNTVINKEGTFVKAPENSFDKESEASTYLRGKAPEPEGFRKNGNKVKKKEKAGKAESLTLGAGNYGKVKAGKEATITFSGGDIFIRSLKVGKGVNLVFTDNTVLLVRKAVKLGKNTAVNTAGEQMRIYAGGNVSIGNGSEVRGYLHSQGRLKTRRGGEITSLEGLFVADRIRGGKNTHWAGGGVMCTANEESEALLASGKERRKTQSARELPADSVLNEESIKISVFPNPASEQIRVEVNADTDGGELLLTDLQGNVKMRKTYTGQSSVQEINIKEYPTGLYLLKVSHKGKSRTVRVFKE